MLNKKIFLLLLSVISMLACGQSNNKPTPYIGERIELMNIVFKLAGAQEYDISVVKPYAAAIDNYFSLYKEHELIKLVSELRRQYYIGWDAVATYAVLLNIKDGRISFIDNAKLEFDRRWKDDTPYIFLDKLNDFYAKSGFRKFFTASKPIYDTVVSRYKVGFNTIDFDWFDRYFGKKPKGSSFNLVLSPLGDYNYGPKVVYNTGEEELYAVIAAYEADDLGYPKYDDWSYDVVVHEFSHSYTNPLITSHFSDLQINNEKFYDFAKDRLHQISVGSSKLHLYETLVRAVDDQYHKEHSDFYLYKKRINSEQRAGFLWMGKLCDLLSEEYEPHRDKYPTLNSFMPEIVNLLNSLSPEVLDEEFKSKAIKIIKSSIPDGSTSVDPETKTLILTFEKPMFTGEDSFEVGEGKLGEEYFPKIVNTQWSEDARELIIKLELEAGKKYSLSFPAFKFIGKNYEPLLEKYDLNFETLNH